MLVVAYLKSSVTCCWSNDMMPLTSCTVSVVLWVQMWRGSYGTYSQRWFTTWCQLLAYVKKWSKNKLLVLWYLLQDHPNDRPLWSQSSGCLVDHGQPHRSHCLRILMEICLLTCRLSFAVSDDVFQMWVYCGHVSCVLAAVLYIVVVLVDCHLLLR